MRFDWYAATIQEHPDTVVSVLAENLGADAIVKMKGGRHGYTSGTEIRKEGGVVVVVLAGGVNPWPSAKASGSATDDFVGVVRGSFGNAHHVSRLDACEDFDSRGCFERLEKKCRAFADEFGLKKTYMETSGKHGNEGRTLYVGAPSSDCRVRLYEKGEEMRGKFPGRAAEFSRDWVRIEAQVRPQELARISAARVSPKEAWGFSRTSRILARECLGLEVERIAGPRHDLSNYESSADHLAMQYRKTIVHLEKKSEGDALEFRKKLFERIERVKESKRLINDVDPDVLEEKDRARPLSARGVKDWFR